MDGGFFKGTTTEQDSRFSDKQSKLMRQMKFSDILENKIDMSKVDLKTIKPWINKRLTELLGFDDDVVVAYVFNQLETKHPNPKEIQVNLTGFLNAKNSRMFLAELWEILLSASLTDKGVPLNMIEAQLSELKNNEEDESKIKSQLEDENARLTNLLKIVPSDQKDSKDQKENKERDRETRKRDRERSPRRNNSPRNEERIRRRSHDKKRSGSQARSVEKKKSPERRHTEKRSPDRGNHRRTENPDPKQRDRAALKKENRSPASKEDGVRVRQDKSEERRKRASAESDGKNILNLDYKDNSEEIPEKPDNHRDNGRERRRHEPKHRSRSAADKREPRGTRENHRRTDRDRDRDRSRNRGGSRGTRGGRSTNANSSNITNSNTNISNNTEHYDSSNNRSSRRDNHDREGPTSRRRRDHSGERNHNSDRRRRDPSEEQPKWQPEIVKETWGNKSESPKEVPKKNAVESDKRSRRQSGSPGEKRGRGTRDRREAREHPVTAERRKRHNSTNSSEEMLKKHKIGSMYADRMNEDKMRPRKESGKQSNERPEKTASTTTSGNKEYRRSNRRRSSEERPVERRRDRDDRRDRVERDDRSQIKPREWPNSSVSPPVTRIEKEREEKQQPDKRRKLKRSASSSSSSSSSSGSSDSSSSSGTSSSSDSSSSSSSSSDESQQRQVKRRKSDEEDLFKDKERDDSFMKEEEKRLRQKALESLQRRK